MCGSMICREKLLVCFGYVLASFQTPISLRCTRGPANHALSLERISLTSENSPVQQGSTVEVLAILTESRVTRRSLFMFFSVQVLRRLRLLVLQSKTSSGSQLMTCFGSENLIQRECPTQWAHYDTNTNWPTLLGSYVLACMRQSTGSKYGIHNSLRNTVHRNIESAGVETS